MWHSLPWRPRINRLYKHRKKFANLKKKILYFNLCQNRKFQEMRLNNRNLIKMVTRLCKIFWVPNRLVWPVATCISASWGMKFSCRRLTNIKCFQSIKMLNILINEMGWYRGMELILIKVLQGIMKPKSKTSNAVWPKCSFFGIYDGHGGPTCADFLRDYLH